MDWKFFSCYRPSKFFQSYAFASVKPSCKSRLKNTANQANVFSQRRPLRNHGQLHLLKLSVARSLSPKPAKRCYEKMLDPAKNHVTNFQLKSANNSEILLKNPAIFEVLKINL